MNRMQDRPLGQTAYEAYRDAADGRSLAVVDRAVHISEDEADVLVSKRRERDEELIPIEQLDADDVA